MSSYTYTTAAVATNDQGLLLQNIKRSNLANRMCMKSIATKLKKTSFVLT